MMDNNFSSDIQRLLERSKKEALRHNNSSISPAHLLIAMLSEMESAPSRMIEKASTSASAYELKQQLDEYLFNESNGPIKELSVSDLTNRIVKLSVLEARLMKSQPVDTIHILLALFHNYEVQNMKYMQPFLNAGVTYDKLLSLAREAQSTPVAGSDFISDDDDEDMPKSSEESSSQSGYKSSQTKGKRSRSGSTDTPVLDKFGHDMTRAAAENQLDPVVGRETEIERLAQILSRRKKN
ncbi:MAG: ATP-dependent Clp protease ATP-binding subunit, partial [Muribaculaceae bacterium]|nr:ATP-dependent Clp protease ATP-binding subunit [Muribaculaceae bacterium]